MTLAGQAGAILGDLVKSPDPSSPFKGEFGARKSIAWSTPVPIDEVKAIGAPTGAKVNDVLVAAVAGALRTYLRRRGNDPTRMTLRAMVVDDEPLAVERLCTLLSRIPEVTIAATAESGPDAIDILVAGGIDLLFLDV